MPETTTYKTWNGAVLLPIEDLVFTDWNCNEMSPEHLAELLSDVQPEQQPTEGGPPEPAAPGDNRFDEPIQVIPIKGKKSKWLVIGGEHRTKVMRAKGETHIPAVIRHDLANKSRKDLMLWSVRRNNLRGKINAQKYAEMESELIKSHDMTAEAARRAMLIEGDLAKALRASAAVRDNDDEPAEPGSREKGEIPDVDENQKAKRNQAELLQALKIAEQDVLLDSADTVEHGYLFFVQGNKGQTHLVVDESKKLHGLVASMVAACKGNSAKVDDFLASAITNEIKNWET